MTGQFQEPIRAPGDGEGEIERLSTEIPVFADHDELSRLVAESDALGATIAAPDSDRVALRHARASEHAERRVAERTDALLTDLYEEVRELLLRAPRQARSARRGAAGARDARRAGGLRVRRHQAQELERQRRFSDCPFELIDFRAVPSSS